MVDRRTVVAGTAALALLGKAGAAAAGESGSARPYALIGQMKAAPGKRGELIGYLLEGSGAMPGNLSYQIFEDRADADAIWITEIWRDEAAHKASLSLPGVQAAIQKARPILAGFGVHAEVTPVAPTTLG